MCIRDRYRVWLTQLIDGESEIVSNTVEYEVGQSSFELVIDQLFTVYRDGQLGDQIVWVVERDGEVVLQRNAENELSYQFFNNSPGSSFRVWVEKFIDGEYLRVSNIVEYDVPQSYPFSLSIDSTFEITRSGNLGDNVSLAVIENGFQVFGRSMNNELSYRYFRNFSGRTYTVHLQAFSNGFSRPVSNAITYSVP